jgi:hypothetical protein
MNITIKTYETNAVLFVNDNSYTIDWDGLEFDTAEEYDEWISESLAPIKECGNYNDFRLLLEIATDDLRPEIHRGWLVYMYVGDKPCGYIATTDDIDKDGWVDINVEDFIFASEEDADEAIASFCAYCKEKEYQNCTFKKEYYD